MAWIKMIKAPLLPTMPPFTISDFTASNGSVYAGTYSGPVIEDNSLTNYITSWAYGNQYELFLDYNYPLNVFGVNTLHIEGHRTILTSTDKGYAVINLDLQYSSDGVTYTALDRIELTGWYWNDNLTQSYSTNIDISSYNYIKIRFRYHQLTSDQNSSKQVKYCLDALSFS